MGIHVVVNKKKINLKLLLCKKMILTQCLRLEILIYCCLSIPPSMLLNHCACILLVFLMQHKGHFIGLPRKSRKNLWIPYWESIIKILFYF